MELLQPQIDGDRIYLRRPESSDGAEFTALAKSSRRFHRGLAYPPVDPEKFEQYVKGAEAEAVRFFLICLIENKRIIGAVNLSQIFYGNFKNAYLGYYLFEGFTGYGYMTEALKLVLKYVFSELGLHRLEANIQPDNIESTAVVKRCGFQKEGFSRKYLKVGGRWRDHERWAIIKEDYDSKPGKLTKLK